MTEEQPLNLMRAGPREDFTLAQSLPFREPSVEDAVDDDVRDGLVIGMDARSGRREDQLRRMNTDQTRD